MPDAQPFDPTSRPEGCPQALFWATIVFANPRGRIRAMTDDWQKQDADRGARIVETVNPFLEPVPFNRDSTTVRTLALPFYRGYQLCELTDLSAVPAARKYAICKADDVTVISWTNQDRKSTRLNSSHSTLSRMPSSA